MLHITLPENVTETIFCKVPGMRVEDLFLRLSPLAMIWTAFAETRNTNGGAVSDANLASKPVRHMGDAETREMGHVTALSGDV